MFVKEAFIQYFLTVVILNSYERGSYEMCIFCKLAIYASHFMSSRLPYPVAKLLSIRRTLMPFYDVDTNMLLLASKVLSTVYLIKGLDRVIVN